MAETADLPPQDEDKEFQIPIKPPTISEFIKEKTEQEIEAQRFQEELEKTIDDDAPDVV